MAIRFDSSGECLFRASNLPASTAFTACGWFNKRGSGGTTLSAIAIIVPSSGGGYIGAYSTVDGSKFGIQTDTSAGMVSGGAVTDNQWYFVAMSGAGTGATDAKLRYAAHGASSLTTVANNGSSFTSAFLVVGMNNAEYWGNQTVAGWKVFDRALTDAELLNEMYRLTPASTTNLNSWSPMFHSTVADAAKDYSGNGNNWITNGTLSLEDGPPVSWGARLLTVGAVVIPAATGSLAATETGADTASLSGDVLVAGALAVTETGADTAALVGDVLVTGTLAATESGSDTAAIAGKVFVSGALAATETGDDTAAIVGSVGVSGSLDATESGADVAAFTGTVAVSGTLDATEAGSDTAVIAAVALVQGSLDATESGSDTAAIEGSLAVISTGSLAATESGSDTATFAGVAPVSGALAATEAANDSAAVSGVVLVTGALDATETGSDTAAFASSTPVTTAYPGPAGRATKGKRRRVIIGERLYNVLERDIPALLEAELLDRAPPVTAEVIEGPKPPRKRAKKAPQPVKTVEQVRETVQQIKRRIEPDDAWLAQALEAVAFRVLERLQDEEDSLMLLLAA